MSYQRQLEAGMRNPGSAGLTADRLGDSEKWKPAEHSRVEQVDNTNVSKSEVQEPNGEHETM